VRADKDPFPIQDSGKWRCAGSHLPEERPHFLVILAYIQLAPILTKIVLAGSTLARINTCDYIESLLAKVERWIFKAMSGNAPPSTQQ
jgi:hypothetical protein